MGGAQAACHNWVSCAADNMPYFKICLTWPTLALHTLPIKTSSTAAGSTPERSRAATGAMEHMAGCSLHVDCGTVLGDPYSNCTYGMKGHVYTFHLLSHAKVSFGQVS
jgi:hypothetical protein